MYHLQLFNSWILFYMSEDEKHVSSVFHLNLKKIEWSLV